MQRVLSENPSSMGGCSHHIRVEHFGDSEFEGGTQMASIQGLPAAENNGMNGHTREAPPARAGLQHSLAQAAEVLAAPRSMRCSPTFALEPAASFAASSAHEGGDSLWSESAVRLNSLMKTLTQQLDKFGPKDLLLGEFQLLGPAARRHGGAQPTIYVISCPREFWLKNTRRITVHWRCLQPRNPHLKGFLAMFPLHCFRLSHGVCKCRSGIGSVCEAPRKR